MMPRQAPRAMIGTTRADCRASGAAAAHCSGLSWGMREDKPARRSASRRDPANVSGVALIRSTSAPSTAGLWRRATRCTDPPAPSSRTAHRSANAGTNRSATRSSRPAYSRVASRRRSLAVARNRSRCSLSRSAWSACWRSVMSRNTFTAKRTELLGSHRPGRHQRPPVLVGAGRPVANEQLRRVLVAVEGPPAGQVGEGKGPAVLVPDLEPFHDAPGSAATSSSGVAKPSMAAASALAKRSHPSGDCTVMPSGTATRVVARVAFASRIGLELTLVNPERHLGGDGLGQVDLVGRELVGLVEVDHELAEQARPRDEGHEGEGVDPLAQDGVAKGGQRRFGADVGHEDRSGVGRVRRPRAVAVGRLAVEVRQSPPGREAHDAGVVEHQDGGPVGVQGCDQDVEGLVEDGRWVGARATTSVRW